MIKKNKKERVITSLIEEDIIYYCHIHVSYDGGDYSSDLRSSDNAYLHPYEPSSRGISDSESK